MVGKGGLTTLTQRKNLSHGLQAPQRGRLLPDQASWQTCGRWDVQFTAPKKTAPTFPKLVASGLASEKPQSMFYCSP